MKITYSSNDDLLYLTQKKFTMFIVPTSKTMSILVTPLINNNKDKYHRLKVNVCFL